MGARSERGTLHEVLSFFLLRAGGGVAVLLMLQQITKVQAACL